MTLSSGVQEPQHSIVSRMTSSVKRHSDGCVTALRRLLRSRPEQHPNTEGKSLESGSTWGFDSKRVIDFRSTSTELQQSIYKPTAHIHARGSDNMHDQHAQAVCGR